MALFRDRQEYLETRKLYHDGSFHSELSYNGRRRRRNRDNRDQRTILKMVTGTKDGDISKLAAAQSVQMRLLKAKMSQIHDKQVYKVTKSDL
mmetsp:Transcript_17460/g.23561  ORF Transcript_17460/g.23561 Transcript_17460/m.23561 type:complete len:92 (-) Transcript_17460:185-460(-)